MAICQQCSNEFKVKPYREKTAKYCSYECYWKAKRGKKPWMTGKKHKTKSKEKMSEKVKQAWKRGVYNKRINHEGDKTNHSLGYIEVKMPNHPMADKRGYVLEHRLIMAQKIGRMLKSTELVHHINGDKKDNRIENLRLLSRKNHNNIHPKERDTKGTFTS